MPKPAPAEQVNLEAGKHEANQEMADGDVTEEQLAESSEPRVRAGARRQEGSGRPRRHRPGEYRQQEQQVIEQGKTDAAAETKEGVAGMQGAKGAALAKVVADKGKTKSKDEQKRAEVTAKVQSHLQRHRDRREEDPRRHRPQGARRSSRRAKAARATFENYVSAKMSAYKEDRYGGWTGKFRWLRDKIRGMPDKVNEFYVAGRELYLKQMDVAISRVADIVGNDLTAAKKRIATGKAEISTYVTSLPQEPAEGRLRGVEGDRRPVRAARERRRLQAGVRGRHPGHEVRRGAQGSRRADRGAAGREPGPGRQGDRRDQGDHQHDPRARGDAARTCSPGWPASSATSSSTRSAFLGNLIDGIKGGIIKFKDNFLAHLRKGLMCWLFGALAEGGIELPETFDLKGVIKLLASHVRPDLAQHPQPDRQADRREGDGRGRDRRRHLPESPAGALAGLWEMLLEKLGDIKEMILDQVKDFVLTRIITAGITWLISLLNPAAAFIKACKLIYDVVMFFVEQRQPDREVRQHDPRLRRRHRPRQHQRRRRPRSRTSSARWCRSSSASSPA